MWITPIDTEVATALSSDGGDADNADGAVVHFCVSLAIFSARYPPVQVQRINSREKLALPPPPTCCLRHNAELMNHEHIL